MKQSDNLVYLQVITNLVAMTKIQGFQDFWDLMHSVIRDR